jgi:cytochrome c biogenesis protein CcdA
MMRAADDLDDRRGGEQAMDLAPIGVAVVAAVATFLSPCVLPVLLAASANRGRRPPSPRRAC